jgi:hypothetical protein
MLSGTVETLCRADYSDALLQVAGISTGVRRVFPLSAPPASETGIDVKVDDEAAGGWELRQETGAIGFAEGSEPAPYGLVQIRYPPGCP